MESAPDSAVSLTEQTFSDEEFAGKLREFGHDNWQSGDLRKIYGLLPGEPFTWQQLSDALAEPDRVRFALEKHRHGDRDVTTLKRLQDTIVCDNRPKPSDSLEQLIHKLHFRFRGLW